MNWRLIGGVITGASGSMVAVAATGLIALVGVALVIVGTGFIFENAALSGRWPSQPGKRKNTTNG